MSIEYVEYPTKTVRIPLLNGLWAYVQLPDPMTQEDWDLMLSILDAMKPGIVSPAESESESEDTREK
jgi:hypothetical protein